MATIFNVNPEVRSEALELVKKGIATRDAEDQKYESTEPAQEERPADVGDVEEVAEPESDKEKRPDTEPATKEVETQTSAPREQEDYSWAYAAKAENEAMRREMEQMRAYLHSLQVPPEQPDETDYEPLTKGELKAVLRKQEEAFNQRIRQAGALGYNAQLAQERQAFERELTAMRQQYPDFDEHLPVQNAEAGWSYFVNDPQKRFGINWHADFEQVYKIKAFDKVVARKKELEAQQNELKKKQEAKREQNKQNLSKVAPSGRQFQEPKQDTTPRRRDFRDLRPQARELLSSG